MANVLSLAIKISGDASGLQKSLTPAERAFTALSQQVAKATESFAPFSARSADAARAQESLNERFAALAQQLRDGLDPRAYTEAFQALQVEARQTADAFREGLEITQRNAAAEDVRASRLERLGQLLDLGAISAQNYGREVAQLTDGFDGTQQDRFGEAVAGLASELQAGRISLEQFTQSSAAIASAVESATPAAQRQREAVLALRQQYDSGRIAVEQYREEFAKIQAGEITSTFEVQVLGVRDGIEQTERLRETLGSLSSTEIDAAVSVSGADSLDGLREQLAGIDGAQVDAVLQVLGVENIDAAIADLNRLADVDATATVGVRNVESTRQTLLELEQAFGSLEQAQQEIAGLDDVSVEATLQLLGTDTIDEARSKLEALAVIKVQNRLEMIGFESIEQAQQQLSSLSDVDVTATLDLLGVSSIDDAQARLATLADVDVSAVFSLLGVDSIEQARQQLREINNLEVTARLQAVGIESIEQARDLLGSLEDRNVSAVAEALGIDSVAALVEVINSVEPKTVDVTAETNLDETAEQYARLVAEQDAYNAAAARAAELTRGLVTGEEQRTASAAEYLDLRQRGVLTETQYQQLLSRLGPITEEARAAEAALNADRQRAAQIIAAVATPQERYQQGLDELNRLLSQGLLNQEQFNRAVANAERTLNGAGASADATRLKFNELSGVFTVLPGPLGNIAGRISGLTSAGEGLTRVFSGGFSAGLGNIANSFAALANPATLAAAGIAGVGAAAAAVVNGLVGLEDRVERLSNQAFQLGVSFEFVQTLEESAIRSGTSVDVLRSATTRLQQQLVEAANGSETAQRAIAGLGLAAEDLANASPDEQFRLIAESITSIEDPAERTAAATRLFGEAGVQLLPFFRNLGGAANDMERLNAQLSSVDRARIEELGTSFDGVNVAIRGLGQELLTPFIGITRSISDSLSPAIATFGRNIGALLDIFSPLTSIIGLVVNNILQFVSVLNNAIGTALEPFAAAGRAVSGVYDEISQAITAIYGPINDVVLSFREFFQFEGVFSGIAEAVGSVGQAFQETFGRIADIVSRVATIVTTAFGQLTGVIQRFVGGTVERVTSLVSRFAEFTGLANVVRGFASAVTSAFSGLWEGIKAIVGQVGGFIERVLDFAENWLGISREIEQPVQATIEVNAPQAVQLTEDLAKAQESVAEFGNAGVEAFLEYQAQLEDIAALVAEGEYDGEAQQRAIAQATAEFERQREVLKEQAAEQERLAEAERRRAEEAERAAQRQIDADQRVVDGLLNQIRVEEEFGGDSARARAADNVLSIEREIARVEEEQRKAREAGDQGAVDAAASRLAQLDQVVARERDIASGATAEREAQAKALEDAAKEQERLLEQRRREEDRIQQQVSQAQERYAERATEIEAARLDALNSALAGPVQANDLRSAEGATTFLNLASGAEDPAIAEYRKQLKELQGLRRDIQALETQKAEILAGTG